MKTITTTAIVALMTATIGLSAVAPSYAQGAPTAQQHNFRADNHGPRLDGPRQDGPRQSGRMHARMGGGDILNVTRGAEAVEIALVRLSHRLTLTAEQQPLFDALKTAALTAANDFTSAATALRPAAGEAATRPNLSERLDSRITIASAHLAALEAIQPTATAFFDSLSAEQLAQLTPQRPDKPGAARKGSPAAPAAETAPATNG